MQSEGRPAPEPKKGTSTLTIVLIVLGVLFVLGAGTCAVGAVLFQREAKKLGDDMSDGGIVLVAPPEVTAALAGAKKDYLGNWRSRGGSTLAIDAAGNIRLEKDEDGDGVKENFEGPIARFDGNDIVMKVILTITLHVTEPPHPSGPGMEMTLDGIRFAKH
jgi:hypothetical protein